jgi:hypothetical protein
VYWRLQWSARSRVKKNWAPLVSGLFCTGQKQGNDAVKGGVEGRKTGQGSGQAGRRGHGAGAGAGVGREAGRRAGGQPNRCTWLAQATRPRWLNLRRVWNSSLCAGRQAGNQAIRQAHASKKSGGWTVRPRFCRWHGSGNGSSRSSGGAPEWLAVDGLPALSCAGGVPACTGRHTSHGKA